MDNTKISAFVNEFILGKFLVNFVPGLILFYVLTQFISVSTGEGLTSFLIVTTISWTLGLLLEILFFRKEFYKRWQKGISGNVDTILLLLGKSAVSILIACIFYIDLKTVLDLFDKKSEDDMYIINAVVKFVLFAVGGILLYMVYSKHTKNNTED